MLNILRRLFNEDAWLDRLANQRSANDRAFIRALGRRARAPETIEIVRRPPYATPTRTIDPAVAEIRAQARVQAREEVAAHIEATPRGRERAARFPGLVEAHEARTTRVVEGELLSGRPVPDYWARLRDEARALEAEISTERHAESFAPLSEEELTIREGQLRLVRLLLDMENAREDLARRRSVRVPCASGGSTEDSAGPGAPVRSRGVVMEI